MKFKAFNDVLGFLLISSIGILFGVLVIIEPSMRRDILLLLGPWGTMVLQYYFRKAPPNNV